MKSINQFFFTLLFLFILSGIRAQVPSFITDSLDTYVERALEKWQIPGVAVLVVKDGHVDVMKGYGVREMGFPERVDKNTLFMIASNTKAFTGTAMAMLDGEGKLSLDDHVQKWLPGFTMKDPWVGGHLNLTDVMSHRIGMETFQGDFMYWESNLTSDQVISKFSQLTPIYDFRTKWGYCNAGFVVAGTCLEKATGMSWEEFIQERFFDPLEMDHSLTSTEAVKQAENAARAHTLVDGKLVEIPYCSIDNLAPAASIVSSVNDMSHWIIAQLDSGRFNGGEVIPFEAIQKARFPRSFHRLAFNPFGGTVFSLYGLGWDLQDYQGKEIVSHTGGVDGFVTSVSMIPQENLGIVVLTNTDANWFYQTLKMEIIDAYLGLPYRNYSDLYYSRFAMMQEREQAKLDAIRDTIALKNPPALPLKNFAGWYLHDIYGWVDIVTEKDHLAMTFEHHPGLHATLQYIDENRFLCTYNSTTFGVKVFPFVIEDGKVISFTLSVADFLEMTTYEFMKQ